MLMDGSIRKNGYVNYLLSCITQYITPSILNYNKCNYYVYIVKIKI